MRILVEPMINSGMFVVRIAIDSILGLNPVTVPLLVTGVTRESEPDLFRIIDDPPRGVEVTYGESGGWEITEYYNDLVLGIIKPPLNEQTSACVSWNGKFPVAPEEKALALEYPMEIAGFRVLSVFGKSALSKSEKSATEFNVLWRQFPDDVDKETKFLRVESKLGNVFWYVIHDYHTQFPIFTYRGPHGWFDNNWLNKRPVETPRIEQPPHETMYQEWRAKNSQL